MISTIAPLVFIPTYNERENVELIYLEIKKLGLDIDLLFLDDHSPDGTGDVIDRLAREDSRVHAIHRSGKLGIGSAHQDGIRWAYDQGYKTLVTMDCDFTHLPEDIPRFFEHKNSHDIVVGSRYMDKKSIADWNPFRKFLTYLGHFLTRVLLKMPYDASGAFRLYRLDRIPRSVFDLVQSKSYSFFFESLYILALNRFTVKEILILLPKRTYGSSKMKISDALKSFELLVATWWHARFHRDGFLYQAQIVSGSTKGREGDEQAWNEYWKKKKEKSKLIYDFIASLYRNLIIRPCLNRFIRREFLGDSEVLHAGCGGGEVDRWVVNYTRVTALDISKLALERYRVLNHGHCRLMHASIFDIPAANHSFDGVYNLGVMEHFTEEEIDSILMEFKRVLKPDGKLILFWPPEFGLSVRFLKGVHFVLNQVLRRNVQLHPEEITRLRSREHAVDILGRSGFELIHYFFGPGDFFTYVILVARKRD